MLFYLLFVLIPIHKIILNRSLITKQILPGNITSNFAFLRVRIFTIVTNNNSTFLVKLQLKFLIHFRYQFKNLFKIMHNNFLLKHNKKHLFICTSLTLKSNINNFVSLTISRLSLLISILVFNLRLLKHNILLNYNNF